jgi:hypothetical protein
MTYRHIKNLRSSSASKCSDLSKLKRTKPPFKNKAAYRAWCADQNTDHVFYSTVEGDAPSKRVSNDNPPAAIYGIVADYDAPVDWDTVDDATVKAVRLSKTGWSALATAPEKAS